MGQIVWIFPEGTRPVPRCAGFLHEGINPGSTEDDVLYTAKHCDPNDTVNRTDGYGRSIVLSDDKTFSISNPSSELYVVVADQPLTEIQTAASRGSTGVPNFPYSTTTLGDLQNQQSQFYVVAPSASAQGAPYYDTSRLNELNTIQGESGGILVFDPEGNSTINPERQNDDIDSNLEDDLFVGTVVGSGEVLYVHGVGHVKVTVSPEEDIAGIEQYDPPAEPN